MSAEYSDVYERETRERELRNTASALCYSEAHRGFDSCHVCQKAYHALKDAHAAGVAQGERKGWEAGAEAGRQQALDFCEKTVGGWVATYGPDPFPCHLHPGSALREAMATIEMAPPPAYPGAGSPGAQGGEG